MDLINGILQNPIYILLFGSGGLLVVIIGVIALLPKRNNKMDKDSNSKITKRPIPNLLPNQDYYTKKNSFNQSYYSRNENEQETIDFVSDLTMNSPVNDRIIASKVERKDFNKYL